MVNKNIQTLYFDWLYDIVCGYDRYNKLTYRKLLSLLYDIEFTYINPLDENRAQDGIDFRYRFGYEKKYSRHIIERHLDYGPCSVLEMMVALAFRGEEQIMYDNAYGNRTGQWFWNMIVNLGLGNMNDNNFNEYYVRDVISRFLNCDYEYNGKGGLFTVDNCGCDMRGIEIWTQFMWYLNNIIDETE